MKPTPERIARALANARAKAERTSPDKAPAEVRSHLDDTDEAGTLEISSHDSYQALTLANPKGQPRYLSITTAGWCAPHTEGQPETPPSQHPKRQRVALAIVHDTTTGRQTSAMRITTATRPIVATDDEANGSLADALRELAQRIARN